MRKILSIVLLAAAEAAGAFGHWVYNNLRNFASVLSAICPYLTAFLVLNVYRRNGQFTFGFEWFVPLIFWIVIWILRTVANKTGKGNTIPRPTKRFTKVSEDGEITMPTHRIEELLIYMSDLEDWLEREGLTKNE